MPRGRLIQVRRDTSTDWAAADPVLAAGEPGFDTTTGTLKIGDGATAWSALDATTGGTTTQRWAIDGVDDLVSVPITTTSGDPVLTPSVVNGRLRVTADASTNGNHREALILPGTEGFTDGRVDAIFYGPSVLDPAADKATPQMGLVLRCTATGGAVLDMNISSYVYATTFTANWGWNAGGSGSQTIGTAPAFQATDRSPHIVGVSRNAGTPGTNVYYVDDAWDYAAGDTFTVTGCADTTYNGDFTVSSIIPAGSLAPFPAIIASDAAHTSASARAVDLGLIKRKTPAMNAMNPKQIYPFRASLEIVGTTARGKTWPVGKPEPDWMVTADFSSDTNPVPQASGAVAVLCNHLKNGAWMEFGDVTVTRYR